MANKRMLVKDIVESDAFLDMSLASQALYMHLNMSADDDGFVNNAKRIQRYIGATDEDLQELLYNRFLIMFEDGVAVIKHWRMHNTLSSYRYKETVYLEHKEKLRIKENKAYSLVHGDKLDDTELVELGKRQTKKEEVKPKPKEKAEITISSLIKESELDESVKDALTRWVKYKNERHQPYKPTGFKSLLSRVKSNADKYGDESLVEVIDKSMGQNYQGIVWDWLKASNNVQKEDWWKQ